MTQPESLDLPALTQRLAERPEFAALRVECEDVQVDDKVRSDLHARNNGAWHVAKGCPGWVPEPDPLRAFALAMLKGPWVEVHCWKGGTGLWFFTVRDAAGCTGHGDDPIADYAFWRAVQEWEKAQEAADAQPCASCWRCGVSGALYRMDLGAVVRGRPESYVVCGGCIEITQNWAWGKAQKEMGP